MWDKLNIFSWSKKKQNIVPVQREASVTLTNGDKRVTIHRSPSGNKLASSSSAQHGLDDDNSSEASTSLNFGFKQGGSGRRNSSYSFTREPLDLPTWSNVTSPGFTSRLVQQASENSPLKEFNDSLSHSPFRKSPYKDMGLGEMPFVNYSRKSSFSSSVYPSPQRTSSMRSGVSSSVYNRDRRRNARQGQTFVRIAPIDPSVKANVSISRKSSSPPVDMGSNGSPYPPRSPRAANEHYRAEGLGGIPQQELAMRFNRLWPSSPGGPVPGPGRPSSPTSPSNIMEALTAGRKRTRDQDTYYPPNATPPSVSPPSKISIGIGDTPVRPQVSKRVKFLAGPESHDRPMMVGYPGMGSGDSEPISSESILEQMNQTEKRFLPDSTSTPYSMQKKGIRMPSNDDQASALQSALRKRRSQGSMGAVEEEARGEKQGRFCTCNECYAEAAGISTHDQSIRKDGSLSPRDSDEKSTNTGESKSRETCDKSVSTIEFDRGAYFREVFRKADKKKPSKDDDIDDLLPYGKTVITKEMYDRDKRKRIERYYRILKLKPPEGDKFDPCPGNNSSFTTVDGGSSASANAPSTTSSSVLDVNGSATKPGFNFGSGSPATVPSSSSGGFSFGKQTSPVAPTVPACPTIASPSPAAASPFGTSSLGTAQTSSATSLAGAITSPSVLPPGGSITSPVSQATSGSSGGFSLTSTGSNSVAEAKLSTTPAPTFSLGLQTTAVTTLSTGHTFGSPSTNAALPEANKSTFSFGGASSPAPQVQSFGNGLQTTISGTSSSMVSGGSIASPVQSTISSGTSSGVISFATSTISTPNEVKQTTDSGAQGFSFGQMSQTSGQGNSSTTLSVNNSATTPSSGFSFSGSATSNPSSEVKQTSNTGTQGFSFGQTSQTSGQGNSTTMVSGNNNSATTQSSGFSLSTSAVSNPNEAKQTTNSGAPGFSFGQATQASVQGTGTKTVSGNDSATAPSSGFSFAGSAMSSPNEVKQTTNSGTQGFSFGQMSQTSGQGNAPTMVSGNNSVTAPNSGFSFTGSAISNPNENKQTTNSGATGFSFGQVTQASVQGTGTKTVSGNNSATAPSSGFSFTGSAMSNPNEVKQNTNSGAPAFGQTSQSSAPTFGQTSQTSAPTTTANAPTFGSPFSGASGNSSSGFNFGASSGGFSFSGKVASPNATTAASSIMPSNSTTQSSGNIFGSGVSSSSASSTSAGVFGASTGPQTAFGQSAGSTFGSSGSGGFNFAAVPNPLAGNKSSVAATPAFGSSGSSGAPPPAFGSSGSSGASPPAFGSSGSSGAPPPAFGSSGSSGAPPPAFGSSGSSGAPPPAFGSSGSSGAPPPAFGSSGSSASTSVFGGANNNNANNSFAFGGSGAMSPQQTSGGFSFGGNAPQQNTQAPAAPSAAVPFQFGQQAAQGVQGGFNFSAAAPAPSPGGTPMFSMGSASTAPRRRDVRRRHR